MAAENVSVFKKTGIVQVLILRTHSPPDLGYVGLIKMTKICEDLNVETLFEACISALFLNQLRDEVDVQHDSA